MDLLALTLLGEEEALRRELLTRLPRWMARLDERERDVLRLLFGLEGRPTVTIAELASMLGLSPARVFQLKERALRRLRWYARHDYHRLDPPEQAPWEVRSERARAADRSRSTILRRRSG